ncbi:uncharacterized protein VTP21DRAFT_6351 [Calcarisporiella thermophila]|uniref:uncharacterized protein n=1 Tax=Calcarisporiella thermophila TaxID=911321 RepID=UPI003744867D
MEVQKYESKEVLAAIRKIRQSPDSLEPTLSKLSSQIMEYFDKPTIERKQQYNISKCIKSLNFITTKLEFKKKQQILQWACRITGQFAQELPAGSLTAESGKDIKFPYLGAIQRLVRHILQNSPKKADKDLETTIYDCFLDIILPAIVQSNESPAKRGGLEWLLSQVTMDLPQAMLPGLYEYIIRDTIIFGTPFFGNQRQILQAQNRSASMIATRLISHIVSNDKDTISNTCLVNYLQEYMNSVLEVTGEEPTFTDRRRFIMPTMLGIAINYPVMYEACWDELVMTLKPKLEMVCVAESMRGFSMWRLDASNPIEPACHRFINWMEQLIGNPNTFKFILYHLIDILSLLHGVSSHLRAIPSSHGESLALAASHLLELIIRRLQADALVSQLKLPLTQRKSPFLLHQLDTASVELYRKLNDRFTLPFSTSDTNIFSQVLSRYESNSSSLVDNSLYLSFCGVKLGKKESEDILKGLLVGLESGDSEKEAVCKTMELLQETFDSLWPNTFRDSLTKALDELDSEMSDLAKNCRILQNLVTLASATSPLCDILSETLPDYSTKLLSLNVPGNDPLLRLQALRLTRIKVPRSPLADLDLVDSVLSNFFRTVNDRWNNMDEEVLKELVRLSKEIVKPIYHYKPLAKPFVRILHEKLAAGYLESNWVLRKRFLKIARPTISVSLFEQNRNRGMVWEEEKKEMGEIRPAPFYFEGGMRNLLAEHFSIEDEKYAQNIRDIADLIQQSDAEMINYLIELTQQHLGGTLNVVVQDLDPLNLLGPTSEMHFYRHKAFKDRPFIWTVVGMKPQAYAGCLQSLLAVSIHCWKNIPPEKEAKSNLAELALVTFTIENLVKAQFLPMQLISAGILMQTLKVHVLIDFLVQCVWRALMDGREALKENAVNEWLKRL